MLLQNRTGVEVAVGVAVAVSVGVAVAVAVGVALHPPTRANIRTSSYGSRRFRENGTREIGERKRE